MNESLEIALGGVCVDGFAIQLVFLNILCRDKFGRFRARQQESIGSLRMPRAYVPEGVYNSLGRKDMVGGNKFLNDGLILCHSYPVGSAVYLIFRDANPAN